MKTPFDRPSGGHVPIDQDTLDELAAFGSTRTAARPTLTLKPGRSSNVSAFLSDYDALTYGNPLDDRVRVWSYVSDDGERVPLITTELQSTPHQEAPIWLKSIASPERQGSGQASYVLKEIARLADKHGVAIWLTPKPFGSLPNGLKMADLKGWYRRHGWVPKGSVWIREPATSPTDRVASAWLARTAARPIRIDRVAVDDLTRRIVDAMRREAEGREDEVVGVREAILDEWFSGTTVTGETKLVMIIVASGRGSATPFMSGGGFGRISGGPYKGAPIIIVLIDGRHTWGTFGDYEVVGKYLNNLLMHEVTHAMDLIRQSEPPMARGGRIPTSDEVDLDAYYNDPREVRAFMRQLYEEIRPLVVGSMGKGRLRREWGPGGAVVRFLRVNDFWNSMSQHLTRQNRNRILKGIMTAFEDDGLSMSREPAARVASAWLTRTAWAGGACNPNVVSTAWITPEGEVISVPPGETHSSWANAHLSDDQRYLDQRSGPARYLMDTRGWVRLVNAYTLETGSNGASDRAMRVAVNTVIDCAVQRKDIDPEVSTMTVGFGSREVRPTIADFVAEYGTPRQVEGMYDRLMARTAASRPRYKDKKEVPKADGSGTTTVYVYGPRQVANRHREKADRIEGLSAHIGGLRRRVKSDLKSDDPATRLTALAVALIDATYERVGNDESADNGHYGVTGWTMDHVEFSKDGKRATFRYTGKSGVEHEKTVADATLIKALRSCCGDKSDTDHILSEGDVRVKSAMVNDYLREFDVTAKDLRGYHANREMQERLRTIRRAGPELPRPRKERDAILKEEFAEALDGAAASVGHEASTLRKQYLVPWLEVTYMKDGTVIDRLDKKASSDAVLYFAYGSNLDPVRMTHRTPSAVPVGTAVLPDHRVTFARMPDGAVGGKAVITPSPGDEVQGVVYRVSVSDMHELDEYEGVDRGNYVRTTVAVHGSDGRMVQVHIYRPSPYVRDEELPSDGYAAVMRRGLAQWGFAPRSATKTHAEREDEEAERLVRRSPKLKPSRDDSKRERVDVSDPDTGDQDRDLSLNYKDNG